MAEKSSRPDAPSDTVLRDAEAARAARDKLRFALEYGVLAPGGHPWMIAIGETAIDFRFGHRCGRPTYDPLHRDAIIGCGIGLAQLKLALHQLGCVDSTILLPEEDLQPDLLARVYIDRVEANVDPQSFVLYQALYTPCSKVPRPIDAAFGEELVAHAQFERAILSFCPPHELPPSEASAPCGAPTLGSVVRRLAWMEARVVQPGEVGSVGAEADLAAEGVIGAVIATKGDRPLDWIAAGQALARVALRARVEGFFTQVGRALQGARTERGEFAQIPLRIGVPRSSREAATSTDGTGHFFSRAPGPERGA
jgi:hypothetical protein